MNEEFLTNSKKGKVLIVDDNELFLETITDALSDFYDVRGITDSQSVLVFLLSGDYCPDLILLDIDMPGISGYDVCRQLKESEITCNLPVIFLTAYRTDAEQLKGLELGAVDFIVKPTEFPLIRHRIQTQLELKWHQEQLQRLVDKKGHELNLVTKRKQEKDRLLQRILMAVPVAVGYIVNRKIVWANPMAIEISGYSLEELEGQSVRMLYPSDEVFDSILLKYKEVEDTGFTSFESLWRRKTGKVIDVHISAVALDNTDPFSGAIFSVLNISKRKQAERALRRSEAKFSQIFNLTPNAITLSRVSDGVYFDVNPGFTDISGWLAQEAIGRSSLDLDLWLSEQERQFFISCLRKKGKIDAYEVRHRHKNGSLFDAYTSARLMKIDSEECLLSIVVDITERKRIEAATLRAKEEWETTFNAMTDMITIHDSQGEIIRANRAACDFFGKYNGDQLVGKQYCEVFWDSSSECSGCPLIKTCASSAVSSEVINYMLSGKKLQVATTPISVEEGLSDYFIHTVRDITEQKRFEEEANRANRLASLGELAAGVAHEINNPNALILYNSEFLENFFVDLMPYLEKEQSDDTRLFGGLLYSDAIKEIPSLSSSIHDSAQRIRKIVNELRDFSRLDSGERCEPVDLNGVVNAAVQLVNNAIKKATDHFILDLEKDLPAFSGNNGRLEQVVVNLLLNSCQALVSRSEQIGVKTLFEQSSNSIQVVVWDEGRGMTSGIVEHIFEPFYTTKREQGGTGLGLSVSNRIIKEHSGTLDFQSALNCGTTVTIHLPLSNGGKV